MRKHDNKYILLIENQKGETGQVRFVLLIQGMGGFKHSSVSTAPEKEPLTGEM
jgi:hypothetical protein